jgi:hypothetical protein
MKRTKLSTIDRNFLAYFAAICLLQADVIHERHRQRVNRW